MDETVRLMNKRNRIIQELMAANPPGNLGKVLRKMRKQLPSMKDFVQSFLAMEPAQLFMAMEPALRLWALSAIYTADVMDVVRDGLHEELNRDGLSPAGAQKIQTALLMAKIRPTLHDAAKELVAHRARRNRTSQAEEMGRLLGDIQVKVFPTGGTEFTELHDRLWRLALRSEDEEQIGWLCRQPETRDAEWLYDNCPQARWAICWMVELYPDAATRVIETTFRQWMEAAMGHPASPGEEISSVVLLRELMDSALARGVPDRQSALCIEIANALAIFNREKPWASFEDLIRAMARYQGKGEGDVWESLHSTFRTIFDSPPSTIDRLIQSGMMHTGEEKWLRGKAGLGIGARELWESCPYDGWRVEWAAILGPEGAKLVVRKAALSLRLDSGARSDAIRSIVGMQEVDSATIIQALYGIADAIGLDRAVSKLRHENIFI